MKKCTIKDLRKEFPASKYFLVRRINHRGNKITQSKETIGKSVDKIKKLIKDGVKLDSVPTFFIREGEVGEGNHRVEAFYQMGYDSIPVFITGAWD